jgi:ubiquinol-cytochrome c reductase subunit 7
MRKTSTSLYNHGHYSGMRYQIAHWFFPQMYREYLSVQNAHKVERGVRLQTALKANKVDVRNLLALPVTDTAHPYKMEYPWEKCYAIGGAKNQMTPYGRWYHTKILCFYEGLQLHKFGIGQDDMVQLKGWWNRAARTRAPIEKICHSDRRSMRARMMKDKYIYDKKSRWMHPVDNVAWFGPYVVMVADEWEEKWGFFAGQETEY